MYSFQINGHSGPEMEFVLKGSLFYRGFLGFSVTDPVPDHSTISRFRFDLKASRLHRRCFSEFKRQIVEKGFELRSGNQGPGKDKDASLSKKGKRTIYGYKDHIAIDPRSEFVSEFGLHGSQCARLSGDAGSA